jgi:hypothetical protein
MHINTPRTVHATRYVTPLREGGSLPAIVEADDDGMYVLKFRGAGQGTRALVSELLVGELARAAGLPVPEIVYIELNGELADIEPDPEIQDLIRASAGINIGLDYLPGSITFDPSVDMPGTELSSSIVWFDAFTMNMDRTPRNTNMLMWHKRLYLIDHGAALYLQHAGDDFASRFDHAFPMIKDHVLLHKADMLREVDKKMRDVFTAELIEGIVDMIPGAWTAESNGLSRIDRGPYKEFLTKRINSTNRFLDEVLHARAERI